MRVGHETHVGGAVTADIDGDCLLLVLQFLAQLEISLKIFPILKNPVPDIPARSDVINQFGGYPPGSSWHFPLPENTPLAK
jgi:hypothetical protein